MIDEFWFLDSRVRILVSGAQTSGACALIEVFAPPGHQPPLHVHHEDDEGFYIVEGEVTIWAGDERHVLSAGDYRVAPKGVPHTVRTGESGAHYLVTDTPANFEVFVRAVGSPEPDTGTAADCAVDMTKLICGSRNTDANCPCS